MPHLVLELVLWTLLAFLMGCIIGYVLRALLAGKPMLAAVETPPADHDDPDSLEQPPATIGRATMVVETAEDLRVARAERPKGIAQARGGKSDNLQRISGIGPKNERTLHGLGFFHFDQIAGWSDEEVAWVDDHLRFNGRIIREEWILQAGLLAEGNEDEFERLYGAGRRRQGTSGPN